MYMSKKPYAEQIRIPTQKAADNTIETKHSEFKKPYLSDTYEEMEYLADAPPGFAFAPSGMDTPWMGTPVPNFGSMYTPWHLTFFCNPDPCWCEGDTKSFLARCTHDIVGVEFVGKEPKFEIVSDKSAISILAYFGASGSPEIDIRMRALRPWPSPHGSSKFVYGTHSNISIPECAESECCVVDTGIAWNDAGSDDTIARSGSAAVAITGSNTPFTWAVSGTGFTLDYATTTGLTNTLRADASACGAATVTVTGCDGSVATGYVRCTTGGWIEVDRCEQNGGYTSNLFTYYEPDNYTMYQDYAWCENGYGTSTECCGWPHSPCAYCASLEPSKYTRRTIIKYNWLC
uniref:Uncharacterized protein n=2 Tax=viral metagenome TaxID=1070528 RepID=A0A6M3KDX5_9ZZZZ